VIQVGASISISCSSTTTEVVGRIGIRRYAMGKEDTGQGAEGVSRVGVKQMVGSCIGMGRGCEQRENGGVKRCSMASAPRHKVQCAVSRRQFYWLVHEEDRAAVSECKKDKYFAVQS
jgi:hypothetical protein